MARPQGKSLLLAPSIHGAPYRRRSPAAYGDVGLVPQISAGDDVVSCQNMVGGKQNDDAVRSHLLEVKIGCAFGLPHKRHVELASAQLLDKAR